MAALVLAQGSKYTYAPPGTPPFPSGAPLTALSRDSDHMEVWLVGNDRQVYGNYFVDSDWKGWYKLPGPTIPPGAHIRAVSRIKKDRAYMDIWAVCDYGVLHGNWWDSSKPTGS